eukprot:CAMPEP_0194281460 /NCGR_PEP_ID=MMETSP0169-20130528/20772_1 /TAXON_ID=218684 /ORGANISM="Corethron pennatum, Strain L29A3" /LENGTH=62 /DNA_ID=CAMNT_0039026523 /DNA_START=84 /DNA_END=269 /DNA_ORIENTATION=-
MTRYVLHRKASLLSAGAIASFLLLFSAQYISSEEVPTDDASEFGVVYFESSRCPFDGSIDAR